MHRTSSCVWTGYTVTVLQLWMDSPSHRANILNEGYKYLGLSGYEYSERIFAHPFHQLKSTQSFSGTMVNNSSL